MLRVEIEDTDILNERPIELTIGPRKKKIVLRYLSPSEYFDRFVPDFTAWLISFGGLIGNLAFPDSEKEWKDPKVLEAFRRNLLARFQSKKLRTSYLRILKRAGVLKMSVRYFEKYATVVDLVRIFVMVYRFNVDGYKKKVLSLLQEIQDRGSSTSTRKSSSEDGFRVGQVEKLRPRFRVLTNSPSRSSKSISSSGEKKKPRIEPKKKRSDEPTKQDEKPKQDQEVEVVGIGEVG